MSSFFTVPGGQKKRKRPSTTDAPKKRFPSAASKKSYGAHSKVVDSGSKEGKDSKDTRSDAARSKKTAKQRKEEDDESVSGSDSDSDAGRVRGDDDDDIDLAHAEDDSDLDEAETAAERRLRLAERYLDNVRQEVGGAAGEDGDIYAFDAEDVDRDLIAARLQEDVAESKGRVYRQLADELDFGRASHCAFRWNAKNVNGVAVCAPFAYTVSSDVQLTKWRLQELPAEQTRVRLEKRQAWEEAQAARKKANKSRKRGGKHRPAVPDFEAAVAAIPPRTRPESVLTRRGDPKRREDKAYRGHVGAILCVAASQDGKFVVTGGADRRMVVWDAVTLEVLRVFSHHRDAVTGLAFRRGSNQLYSSSKDRTIKIWSLDELAYVQTLFGHQDDVTDIDALAQEKCVSVGSRDRTARMWKVVEETQLVFRGGGSGGKKAADGGHAAPASLAHEGTMDRVAMLDDELFVTGSDNGALALWSTQKKKALSVIARAHGIDAPLAGRETYDAALASPEAQAARPPPAPQPRWITALRTIPYSDVVLSGSWDGCLRVWKLSKDKRKLEPMGVLGVPADGAPATKSPFSIHGVVNEIATFERGDRGRDGLCVVAAVGQQHRFGRWGKTDSARNGAVVFEVARLTPSAASASDDEMAE